MPKFSIIIPVYNVAPYLRECLDSVLAQDFENWECVVVDDESTDEGPGILDEYASKDCRVRVIHQKNKGEGGARNAGLAVARGEWVFFLDGDDVMAPRALGALSKIALEYPCENLIRFGFANFNDGMPLPKVSYAGLVLGSVDVSKTILYNDYCVYVWQFLFKRSLIAGMKFDRYKRGADRTFIVPVLCFKAQSFLDARDVFYFYRKRPGSAVNSCPSVQVLKDELTHRVDVIEAIDASGKIMPYAETDWLERYCVRTYLGLSLRSAYYSRADQEDLLSWFYQQLPRLRKSHGFSRLGKFVVKCYSLWPYATMRRVVCAFLPFVYRMCSAMKDPATIVSKIMRRIRVCQ